MIVNPTIGTDRGIRNWILRVFGLNPVQTSSSPCANMYLIRLSFRNQSYNLIAKKIIFRWSFFVRPLRAMVSLWLNMFNYLRFKIQVINRNDFPTEPRQSHATIAGVDKHSDGSYVIKPLKQKLFVDGMAYLLQEIYGIENKNASRKCVDDDDSDENAAECVICMSDVRDTLILPCRHLCLCHSCADSLRYQVRKTLFRYEYDVSLHQRIFSDCLLLF